MDLLWPVIVIISLLVVSLGIWGDIRTGRGIGIAIMALVLMGIAAWFVQAWLDTQKVHETNPAGASWGAFGLSLLIVFSELLTLAIWAVSLAEAGAARHWRWFIGLVVTALIAFGLASELGYYPEGADAYSLPLYGIVERLGSIWPPAVVILAYGISRTLRPARPRTSTNAPAVAA